MSNVAPVEIRNLVQSRVLEIQWSDYSKTVVSHRHLREHCRCTYCRTHALARGTPVTVDDGISLRDIVPVGEGGVQLFFTDGHSRGVYPWEYLRNLDGAGAARLGFSASQLAWSRA